MRTKQEPYTNSSCNGLVSEARGVETEVSAQPLNHLPGRLSRERPVLCSKFCAALRAQTRESQFLKDALIPLQLLPCGMP